MNCVIDGKPLAVEQPASVAELRQLVARESASGQAIYPVGGRTMLELGLPPARDGMAIDMTRFNRIIDYPSRDMTITVEAGIRIATLQETLRAEGQRLPVDVPRAGEATLGGSIATNTSGPRRYGFGTFRDYVIGVSVVHADGTETKAGGRVVKNVAGYDLCKLYTGSLGTLGIITQVTLKLKPIPQSNSLVALLFQELKPAAAALDRLNSSRTRPVAIELFNPAAAEFVAAQIGEALRGPTNGSPLWMMLVGFEENSEAVRWQEDQLVQEIAEFKPWTARVDGQHANDLWDLLGEFQSTDLGPLTFKANVPSSAVAEFLDIVERQQVRWSVQVHAGSGIAFGHSGREFRQPDVAASVAALRSFAVTRGGNLIVRRCPTEWKPQVGVWGEPRGDGWLMQAIKRKLDPHNVLNPGRFIE